MRRLTTGKIFEPIISKTLIRLLNPETYTNYCVYSEKEVNNKNLAQSKHIVTCNSMSCEYYRRLVYNTGGVVAGTAVTAASGGGVMLGGSFIAEATVPIAGGLTVGNLALATCAVTSMVGLFFVLTVAGVYLMSKGASDTVKGIENELKLKWEAEKKKKILRQ